MTVAGAEAVYAPAAADALAAFPVQVSSMELLHVSENVTWRVTDESGSRYVLRLHRPGYHTLEELISERFWIRALAAAGVRVPQGIPTRNGEEYVTVRVGRGGETRHAGLAEWTDGEVLEELLEAQVGAEADPELLDDWFLQLGALIAVMHNQASTWTVPAAFTRHALDADGLMGQQPFWGRFWDHQALTPAERALFAQARARLHAELSMLPKSVDGYSLIHADLHPGNLLVRDRTLAVIDFDDAGFGWHVYDLAVALRPYQGRPIFSRVCEAALQGYRSRRPLSEEAAASIPLFILIRRLASVGWIMQRPELAVAEESGAFDALCADVREYLSHPPGRLPPGRLPLGPS
jgi:Ser/Thr protein kinase RdoA (MazF antagonist)